MTDTNLEQPLHFAPILHSAIWGGGEIARFKGCKPHRMLLGESWELSGLPGRESIVDQGPFKGKTITELAGIYGASLLGERVFAEHGPRFPLIVKIIDACRDLSVQVHPGDALAMRRHGCNGKTEAWYVLSSKPDSKIYLGLKDELNPAEFDKAVADGTITDHLAAYSSEAGDSFFVPAGRIHTIGGGNLLVEVQQCCDITYRIFDFNRRDADGNLRTLHTEAARDAIDYRVSADYRNRPERMSDIESMIVSCDKFSMTLVDVVGSTLVPHDVDSFTAIMCIEGELELEGFRLTPGTTLLIPAAAPVLVMTGNGKFLNFKA